MKNLTVELSNQASDLLEQLAAYGIYGQTAEEVAGRFIDQKLIEMTHQAPPDISNRIKSIICRKRKRRRK